jgi:hypothetical protein
MNLLSRIAGWLGENEATISSVGGITVLAGVLFAGLRSLLRRRAETSTKRAPAASAEPASAAEASAPELDPLTLPGFDGARLEPRFVDAFLGLGSTYTMELLHQWADSPARSTGELLRTTREYFEIDAKNSGAMVSVTYE